MYYISDSILPCEEFTSPQDMYPSLGEMDIQPAKYREVYGEKCNRDICALPPLLTGVAIVRDNYCYWGKYDSKRFNTLSKSERLAALSTLKDDITVFLPWHEDMEQRFQQCILSAYSRRHCGTLEEDSPDVLSVSRPIATSVQDISLIGTAGTGKSTAVRMMIDRYPRAIRHEFDGKKYVQVPILESVSQEGDLKSIFVDLAQYLDNILGTTCYETEMLKKQSTSMMAEYLKKLIRVFHVGIIVIDEIQNDINRKENMFKQILGVTASTSVSIMIIGTESALSGLAQNSWFNRRFGHLGRIYSDFDRNDKNAMKYAIQYLWKYNMTGKDCPLTEAIQAMLLSESCQNIDLLTTIFVTAQLLCIQSEKSGNELALDERTIHKAANRYSMAKTLLQSGKEDLALAYQEEKRSTFNAIASEQQAARKHEQNILMEKAVNVFIDKQQMVEEILGIVSMSGFDDRKTVQNIIRRLSTDEEFLSLGRNKQARIVLGELFDSEKKSKKKLMEKPAPKKPYKNSTTDLELETQSSYGIAMLQTTLS